MATYQPSAKKSRSAASTVTHESIVKDVRAGNVKPVYYLMGEEAYYIDRIADFLIDSLLTPEERDFNFITYYGAEAQVDNIINSAKGFPIGSQRLVVLVKEAQALRGMERLEFYLRQPQPTTVLILCHKNGTIDRRLKVAAMVQKIGVLYESKKLYERELPAFIKGYVARKRFGIDATAAEMLADFVGSDLNRIAGELDKLMLALPKGETAISPELVEKNIGISKNFNVYELQEALIQKDVLKVNRIAKYFDSNPKANPIQMVLPSLFRFFSQLMLAYYSPDKSERGLAAWLGMTEWQVKRNILPAFSSWNAVKVMYIISEIRRTDARSKGVNNPSISSGELMKELLYYILH